MPPPTAALLPAAAPRRIDILEAAWLRGPNVWTYYPVIEAVVDIGGLEDCPSDTIPGLPERLAAWLPGLVEHRCSVGERGGFLKRLRDGTWAGHILEHVALELQSLAGLSGGFGRARETDVRGVYKVVVGAVDEDIGRAALAAARDLVMAAIEDRAHDVAAAVAALRERVESRWLGPSTACIVQAAEARRIPAVRLNDANLVQLGYGARQRRIWTAETSATGAIAETISRDKQLTRALLAEAGVPVPRGRLVDGVDDAWAAACDIGLPVVVKPSDGNHGRGVFTNLGTRDEIEAAWRVAVDEGSGVIVERFVPGAEHRLLVVGRQVVAAARGEPAWVTGDGAASVEALVESQLNTDPRRGRTEDHPLNPVRIDSAARLELARQGLEPHSVPEAGRAVLVQRHGNVAFDVTDRVHPDVAHAACLAARVVGLDVAGIDLVAEDVSRPLAEQAGAIVEVNAGPGLLMHLRPAGGQPRPVGAAIVDHLFPDGDDGRIPVVGVAGTHGRSTVAQLVACLLRVGGHRTGLACADGVWVDRRRLESGTGATWEAGRRLLVNRAVDAAVIESDGAAILTQGLPYDRCAVGVVTNIEPDAAMARLGVRDPEQLYRVLRCQVDVVLAGGAGVLNAREPLLVEMADLCDGEVVLFAADADLPAVAALRARGGRAVLARDGRILLAHGAHETVLAALSDIPLTAVGRSANRVENVLAAVGAAWALGLSPAVLRAGVEAFGVEPARPLRPVPAPRRQAA